MKRTYVLLGGMCLAAGSIIDECESLVTTGFLSISMDHVTYVQRVVARWTTSLTSG
jgi:hypothetical protein